MISDNGRNFVSNETVEFANRVVVDWRLNWHRGFFGKMVRSTKTLLKKTLPAAKLTYEELQILHCKAEQRKNNRPIKYYYPDNEESCLTPNYLLLWKDT